MIVAEKWFNVITSPENTQRKYTLIAQFTIGAE